MGERVPLGSTGRQASRSNWQQSRPGQLQDKENAHVRTNRPAESLGSTSERPPHRVGGPLVNVSNLTFEAGTTQKSIRERPKLVQKEDASVSIDVMNTNFEEWMKMATDNRINPQNSWNFALIDYFHDMSLLREGDGINFTKASCTLDGCVKIYTSRVDSIAAETGKLLSGLAEESSGQDGQSGRADDEEGLEDEEKRARRKNTRVESTLANSFATLSVKKFELDFAVDPLFQKTSADFDEGGAKGLLLNHLSVDRTGRVVFDSTDAGVDDEDELEAPVADPGYEMTKKDLELLLDSFTVDMNTLDDYVICPTLEHLVMWHDSSTENKVDMSRLHERMLSEDLDNGLVAEQQSYAAQDGSTQQEDFFADAFEADNGFDDVMSNGDSDGGDTLRDRDRHDHGMQERSRGDSVADELISAMGGLELKESNDMFSYFDNAFMKKWAGPEHWRMRRVIPSTDKTKGNDGPTKVAKVGRSEAKQALIDFHDPSNIPDEKTLFKCPANPRTLLQNKTAIGEGKGTASCGGRDNYLLPNDLHFNSKQLLRLFTKPRCSIRFRKTNARAAVNVKDEAEIDSTFWAAQTTTAVTDQSGHDDAYSDAGIDHAAQYEDQFFGETGRDDGGFTEDLGFDSLQDGTAPLPEAFDQQVNSSVKVIGEGEGVRRVKPEYVSYAKVVKKVDVKRLKDDLWKQLDANAQVSRGIFSPIATITNGVCLRRNVLRTAAVIIRAKMVALR